MTDRERLLEQIAEAEQSAADDGEAAICWARGDWRSFDAAQEAQNAGAEAKAAAHHALTALALRDLLERADDDLQAIRPFATSDFAERSNG